MTMISSMLTAIVIPIVSTIFLYICRNHSSIFKILAVLFPALLISNILYIHINYNEPFANTISMNIVQGLSLSFSVENFGLLFAYIVSFLWLLTSIYSINYLKINYPKRTVLPFFLFLNLAISMVIIVCFSNNLFTTLIAYEILTLITYPLVVYNDDEQSFKAGKKYLIFLMGTSFTFLIPAIAITYNLTESLDYMSGGLLQGRFHNIENNIPTIHYILPILFFVGIAKTAFIPLHSWLPSAMVAPVPVSALLHAVAVVKTGVFVVLKITLYTFGLKYIQEIMPINWMTLIASLTSILASIIAIKQTNIKKILAFSTISNLSYMLLAISTLTFDGIKMAAFYMLVHALAKITLFFSAGNIYTMTKKTEIYQIGNIAYNMPITVFCMLISSAAMVGLPFTASFWFKLEMFSIAVTQNNYLLLITMIITTMLSLLYILPLIIQSYFSPEYVNNTAHKEAPVTMLIPIIITSSTVVFFFFCPNIISNILH